MKSLISLLLMGFISIILSGCTTTTPPVKSSPTPTTLKYYGFYSYPSPSYSPFLNVPNYDYLNSVYYTKPNQVIPKVIPEK